MPHHPSAPATDTPPSTRLIGAILGLFVLLALIKLALALGLDLFGDEAFYRRSAERLAIGFSNLPVMTALWVHIGTALAGDTAIGIRLLFYTASLVIPWAVFWLATPVVGRRDAWFAAALAMLLPLSFFLGVLATPDVPMLLFGLFGLGAFERATRTGKTGWWLATGVLFGLGLSSHYRFVVIPAAAFLYLLFSPVGRAYWMQAKLWLAVLLMLAGLAPLLMFNFQHDFEPLAYQFLRRHPWQFNTKGLREILEQAAVTTPILYAFFLMTLVSLIRRALRGDDRAALFAWIGGVYIVGFTVLAPFSGRDMVHLHWPLPAYLVLAVMVPGVLRGWVRKGRHWRSWLATLVPLTGLLGVTGVVLYIGAGLVMDRAHPWFSDNAFPMDMSGWREIGARSQQALDGPADDVDVILADNYVLAAQLEFALDTPLKIHVLDDARARKHGTAYQHRIWALDAPALAQQQPGADALVVVDFNYHPRRERGALLRRVCGMFDRLQPLGELGLYGYKKRFLLFRGIELKPAAAWRSTDASDCPLPSQALLGAPSAKATVSGVTHITGLAINDSVGVRQVDILLDGQHLGTAQYGNAFSDLSRAFPGSTDPQRPNIGFHLAWDSRQATAGAHTLSVRVTDNNSTTRELIQRRVFVDHNGPDE